MSENLEGRSKTELIDIIEQLRDENRIIGGAPVEAQSTRERDALRIIADIALGTADNNAAPPTVDLIRQEFAGWVRRRTADPKTQKGQALICAIALDTLDDIIAGRMRVVRDAR